MKTQNNKKDCKSLNSKTPNDKDCMQVLNTLPLLGSQKMTESRWEMEDGWVVAQEEEWIERVASVVLQR